MRFSNSILLLILAVFLGGCAGFNLFSIEDDKKFGLQVEQEIAADQQQFPVLPESRYPQVYKYLNDMRDEILKSPHVKYKDEFAWELKVIQDDSTLNAFCTPGGYIYVYTGLIKYLNSADALAGVVGHEIAHADRRHSTRQMSKQYGTAVVLELALGENAAMLKEITAGLVGLKFSRTDESDADEHSVMYLCGSRYRASGAADFFKQLNAGGGSRPPEFMSTHPDPVNRVENIEAKAVELSCGTKVSKGDNDPDYERFKALLP